MNKRSIPFVILLTALTCVPFSYSKVIGVKAEKICSLDDFPRMPTMTLYGDTTKEMAFTWNTTNYIDSDLLVVKKSIGSFDDPSVLKFSGTIEQSKIANDGFIHRVVATNLQPNTEYLYRFGDDDVELDALCEAGTFKTSSESDDDFTFLHISDPQLKESKDPDNYHSLLEIARRSNPSFMALTGDIVNNSWIDRTPVLEQWEWVLTNQWDVMKDIPVAPVSGNHDEAYYDFSSRYTLSYPEDMDLLTGGYYSFDYNGVHFTCIDSNDTTNRDDASNATGIGEKQLRWIENDLSTHQKSRFRIALMHKGIFDAGSHCNNTAEGKDYDIIQIRKQLAPLFYKYNVSLVLQGHDHLYSLSYPVVANNDGDYIDEKYQVVDKQYEGESIPTFTNVKGTIYMNSGSSSGSKYYTSAGQEERYHIQAYDDSQARMFSEIKVQDKTLICHSYKVVGDSKYLINAYAIEAGSVSPKNKNNNPNVITVIVILGASILVISGISISILMIVKKRKRA